MSKTQMSARSLIETWKTDPAFAEAFAQTEDEFAMAAEIIAARKRAGLTQTELAERMNTTQSAVARLESGKTTPSTRTLERLAAATGSSLQIRLLPI